MATVERGASSRPTAHEVRTVGHNSHLQVNAEIRLPEQLNHFLKQVTAFPTDSNKVSLNGRLHLDLAVLDGPDNVLAFLYRQS